MFYQLHRLDDGWEFITDEAANITKKCSQCGEALNCHDMFFLRDTEQFWCRECTTTKTPRELYMSLIYKGKWDMIHWHIVKVSQIQKEEEKHE